MSKVSIKGIGEFDAAELWSCVFGSAWETWDWWVSIDYIDGDWDKICTVKIVALDPDDEDEDESTITKTIGLDDIVRVLNELADFAPIVECLNHDDFDAVWGDCVLQHAVFGETIYG
jgi:hypothetical protein